MSFRSFESIRTSLIFAALVWWPFVDGARADQRGYQRDGKTFQAPLRAIDDSWSATFHGLPPLPSGELVYWGQLAENHADASVLLSDGSLLVASILSYTPDQVTLGPDPQTFRDSLWPQVQLPREMIRGAIYRSLPAVAERDAVLRGIEQYSGAADTLWLSNGDRVEGELLLSQLQGRGGRWRIRTDAGELDIASDKLLAIALASDSRLPDNPRSADEFPDNAQPANTENANTENSVLGFRDGSALHVRALERRDNGYAFRLSNGVALAMDADEFSRQICYFRPANERVAYLSDRRVLSYRHIPYLSLQWPYHVDRSVMNTRLRTPDGMFAKGLGVHSTSRLAYDIPPGVTRFQAELALDATAGEQGSVIYRVYLQTPNGRWNLGAESPVVRGGQVPQSLGVAIGEARRIALIVEFADRGDVLDRANWLMARFVR